MRDDQSEVAYPSPKALEAHEKLRGPESYSVYIHRLHCYISLLVQLAHSLPFIYFLDIRNSLVERQETIEFQGSHCFVITCRTLATTSGDIRAFTHLAINGKVRLRQVVRSQGGVFPTIATNALHDERRRIMVITRYCKYSLNTTRQIQTATVSRQL